MPMLPSQRHLFDIPHDVAYFNCAYMGPLPRAVADAGRAALDRKLRPWTIRAADFFTTMDRARVAVAGLLGGSAAPDDIALAPSVSYGMGVAAASTRLAPGDRVLLLAEEFPSQVLTWRARTAESGAECLLVPRPSDGDWTAAVLAALDARVRAAVLPQVHWVDGTTLDLPRIAARLRELDATLALDLTQSCGAMPFDLDAVRPDFVAVACYKWLLSPYSTGFLYVAPHRREGRPLEQGWLGRGGSEDFSALTAYRDDFQPGARRYDVGEAPNFALLPAMVAALEQIATWGVANIAETVGAHTTAIAAGTAALGLSAAPVALRAPHYLALRAAEGLPQGLVEALAREQIHVSVRGGNAVRITPHVYTEPRDITRLCEVLATTLA